MDLILWLIIIFLANITPDRKQVTACTCLRRTPQRWTGSDLTIRKKTPTKAKRRGKLLLVEGDAGLF